MPELRITDEKERELILSALISHAFKCQDTLKLHNETKDALKENAITLIAERAKSEMEAALTMVAKYYGVHLANSKFYCLNCAPSSGEERERMTDAGFARLNECSNCGMGAYYFVPPKIT
ncbi:MAG TPA: hypothetical protein V6C86_21950 [Oculatellaceae cyanobacterium]